MRVHLIRPATALAAGLAAAVALIPAGAASAASADRATGGGQVLVGTRGAGDTIAFTARGTAEAAGQIQYVDRHDGTGQGQTVHHGSVVCLDVAGNVAKIAGTWRDGGAWQLYVEDNGEGAAAGNDIVTLMSSGEATCDFDEPEDDDKIALARGNAQVHDA